MVLKFAVLVKMTGPQIQYCSKQLFFLWWKKRCPHGSRQDIVLKYIYLLLKTSNAHEKHINKESIINYQSSKSIFFQLQKTEIQKSHGDVSQSKSVLSSMETFHMRSIIVSASLWLAGRLRWGSLSLKRAVPLVCHWNRGKPTGRNSQEPTPKKVSNETKAWLLGWEDEIVLPVIFNRMCYKFF